MKKLVFLFLFFVSALFATTDDSVKMANKVFPLKYYTIHQFEYPDSASFIDNTLLDFQNYLPRNTLGNSGQVDNDFIYRTNFPIGFNYGRNHYLNYFYTPFSIKFYNTRIPYTDLLCVFGSQREQFFKMTLSHNIKKNWNMTANFSRIKATGFYLKQRTDHTFFALSSNYRTLDNRYMLLFTGTINTIKNEENGGMINDSAFLEGSPNYNPSLADARNYRANKNIFLKQYLNLGHRVNDTSPVIPASRFILTSEFDDNAIKYNDFNPLSGYYKNVYYDSLLTKDSVYVMKLENEIAWKRADNLKHRGWFDMIGAGVSIKHQYISVEQREIDTAFNNIFIGGELSNLYSSKGFYVKISGALGVNGYNKDDKELAGTITKVFKGDGNRFILMAKEKEYAPPFMYNHFFSNHFKWINDFKKTKEQSITADLFLNRYDLTVGINFTNYSNVLFFDYTAIARQYSGTIPVFAAFIKKNFELYNWHLNNKVHFQKVPDLSAIRVPQFILQHSFYYENDLFEKALRFQAGLQVFFNTAYYANAYMPATGQFYLQNDKKYGNYPVVDFFLNLKIKVVNIFFKIDHLNSGLSGNNYMLTPGYALNQRTLRFGASWKFWD